MDEVRQRDDRIVQNAWFLAKESWRWDKRILVFLGITTVTGTALPLFGIYLPKVAVDLLLQRAQAAQVLRVLGGLVGCLLILQGIHGYLSKRAYYHHNECRNTFFIQRLFLVSLQCKYSYAEDGEFYKLYRRAINSVRSGDASGTSVFFDQIPKLLTAAACFFSVLGHTGAAACHGDCAAASDISGDVFFPAQGECMLRANQGRVRRGGEAAVLHRRGMRGQPDGQGCAGL